MDKEEGVQSFEDILYDWPLKPYKFQDRGVDRQVSKESKEEARVEKRKAEKAAAVNKFLTEKGDAREKVTLSEMISKKQEGKASDKKASRRKDKD